MQPNLSLKAGPGAGGPAPPARAPRLVYFVNLFPNLIETMIYREVEGLRRLRYDIHVFSIRRPNDAIIPGEARHLAHRTTYILPVRLGRLLSRHLSALRRYRWRYAQVLLEVVSGTHTCWRDRLRTVCHFAEAVIVLPDVERLHPDHLHAHWAVGSATCAMVVSRFLEIPFTFTAHAYDIWRERLLLPQKLQATALAITCTAYNREHLIDAHGAFPERVRVVYHGLDIERFRPRSRPLSSEPVILSVGRLVEQKGFDRLLRACGVLAANGQRFRCDIVGDGPLRQELERLAIDLGLAGRVRFLGRLHQEDIIGHYAAADLFALLCVPASDDDRDGIPNTLIEAMAMELPCVSTTFSGVPELVLDGKTGLLVGIDDHEGAVAALRTLLRDAELRQRMGQAGRRRVAEAFTIEASVASLDGAFSGLRTARASAAA